MSAVPHFVRCAFCPNYGQLPDDGSEVPLDWFFVARPRTAKVEEQTEHQVPTYAGVETIVTKVHVDKWMFCSVDCLAHIAEFGEVL